MELENPASMSAYMEATSSGISVSTNRQICLNVDGRSLVRNHKMDEVD